MVIDTDAIPVLGVLRPASTLERPLPLEVWIKPRLRLPTPMLIAYPDVELVPEEEPAESVAGELADET